MIRGKRVYYVVVSALVSWATAGSALAEDKPAQRPGQQTQVTAQKMSATATVEKVDTADRELTLKDAQGDSFQVQVPQDVKRFEAIKKGDRVRVDYYQSLALSLKKEGMGDKERGVEETTRAERTPGKLPGGIAARTISGQVEVVKVDRGANKLTIKTPDGEQDTINVTDPAMQQNLDKLQKGDRIHATYSQAVAISVTPHKAG